MHNFPIFFAGVLGVGAGEMILIFGVLLLFFGGSKLPDLAKGLGKSIKEFKQASRDDPEPSSVERAPAESATLSEPSAAKRMITKTPQ